MDRVAACRRGPAQALRRHLPHAPPQPAHAVGLSRELSGRAAAAARGGRLALSLKLRFENGSDWMRNAISSAAAAVMPALPGGIRAMTIRRREIPDDCSSHERAARHD